MARKAKSTAGPNAGSRKAQARKAQKCQLCGTKVGHAKAKSIVVDPPGDGDVKIVKAREGKSYWCGDCAKSKAASYERSIANKIANGGSKKKTAAKGKAKKTAAKGKAKPAARKRSAAPKKGTRKRKTAKAGAADPF